MLRVAKGALPQGAQLATGIVDRGTEARQRADDDELAIYSYADQSDQGDGLGMAVVAKQNSGARYRAHRLSHLMVFSPDIRGVNYEMVAAWELGVEPVASVEAFEAVLARVMKGR